MIELHRAKVQADLTGDKHVTPRCMPTSTGIEISVHELNARSRRLRRAFSILGSNCVLHLRFVEVAMYRFCNVLFNVFLGTPKHDVIGDAF